MGTLSYTFEVIETGHRDGDDDKTKEEYDADNHADQENPNHERTLFPQALPVEDAVYFVDRVSPKRLQ